MRKPVVISVAALTAAFIAGATVASAAGAIPGPRGQIQGCYNNATGVLRVVPDASQRGVAATKPTEAFLPS